MEQDNRKQLTAEIEQLRRRNVELEAKVDQHEDLVARLSESQERLNLLFELAPDGYYLNDLEGNFIDGNRAAEVIVGYSRDELIGKSFLRLSLLDVKDIPKAAKMLALNAVGRSTGPDVFTLNRKDRSKVTVEIRTHPVTIEGKKQVLAIARDVTERWEAQQELQAARHDLEARVADRTAELSAANERLREEIIERNRSQNALQESEQRYRALFDNAPDAVFLAHADTGEILDANPAAERLVGRGREELVGKNQVELHPAEGGERAAEAFRQHALSARNGDAIGAIQGVVERSDGTEVPVEVVAQMVELSGVPVLQGTFRDITERKRMEEALRVSQERYCLATEAARIGIWDWDIENDEFYLDPNVKGLLGYTDAEIPNDLEVWTKYVHPDDLGPTMDAAKDCIDGKVPTYVCEHRMLHKDGSIRWMFTRGKAMGNGNGDVVRLVGTDADITERKRHEAALEQARRLESVGRLAAGMAHEFNNMLTGIELNGEVLENDLPQDNEELCDCVREIRQAATKGAQLIRKLVAYGRLAPLSFNRLQLESVVVPLVEQLRAEAPTSIELRSLCDKPVPPIVADSDSIQDVVRSIIANAVTAMPQGGTITVAADVVSWDSQHQIARGWGDPGDYVRLSIRDTGVGMDETVRKRVFEPFFTTQNLAEASGLGMAVAYGIVKGHGGYIEVESTKGEGTTVHLYFPVAAGQGEC